MRHNRCRFAWSPFWRRWGRRTCAPDSLHCEAQLRGYFGGYEPACCADESQLALLLAALGGPADAV
jgi:hypothetical protein